MSDSNEKSITITSHELDELKARLFDAEEHRKGLLQHAHNLEEMLRRKDENIADFIQHLGNLEHLLQEKETHLANLQHLFQEKESDLSQHRIKLQELEARCYRLEQQLRESKHVD